MRPFIAAFLSFAVLTTPSARAADEPEAVYAKYHRAVATRNVNDMMRYASAAQRSELADMSPAQKDAAVKMVAAMVPPAFLLHKKVVGPDGRTARLQLSGPGAALAGGKPETMYGNIGMVNEAGEWKVAMTNWSNTAPAGFPAAPAGRTAPATPAAAKPAPPVSKSAPPARGGGGALVGSTNAPPERKLGQAKEPCVYKPVMTAEDLENCK